MSILKKIKDKTGTIHDLGDSRVDAFETELSGAEHNVPYSPAVLAKTNAIEASVSAHIGNTANPHKVTKAQIGLANVENKSSTQIRSELTKENVTNALGYTPIDESRIGAANGVASLDASGRIPASQIPGGFDNIEEYDNLAAFPTTGEEGKIYVAKDTNLTYRWTGSQYVEISPSLALGETATTAYRGDRGKVAYDHSQVSGNSTIHHTHANKELLDSYTQTEADLANAVAKVHEHGNKDVLDGITSDKVTSWDGKEDAFDVLPTTKGGTGSNTAAGARTNLSVYSKSEIDSLMSDRVEIVTELPATGKSGIIYYVGPTGSGADKYDEYIWTGSAFLKVGEHSLDLSNYVTNAINALDVSSVGGDGKYISEISETDGKISATATTMDATPTENSTKAVTSGGIKTALNNYVTITQENTSSFHIKNNEYYSFICRTQISNWEKIQSDFFCPSSDSSTVGKFNIFATLSTEDTSLHTPERVAELGGVVWDYNYKGYNTIKYRIYVAKSGDNFYFYAKRNSGNNADLTAFRSCLLYTTKKDLTDNISADLDDATWQTLSLVEMTNVYTSTTQERLDSHKNDTTVHITAAEREAWNAKGIVIKEIGGENVICFE